MRRAWFFAAAAALLVFCARGVEAQQPQTMPRIGVLVVSGGPATDGLIRSLAERGYVDGKTARIELRKAEGRLDRLPELARELVALPVDVIVALAASATVAARQATATIPIVMVHAGDPVGSGLVASLARPGGNVTGTSSYAPEIAAKGVELLRELAPAASRLAVLAVPSNAGTPRLLTDARGAAASLGIDVTVIGVERAEELESAFTAIGRAGADSLFVAVEPMFYFNRARILDFAARSRLPAVYNHRDFARDGGLIAYAPLFRAHYPRAADYVDKILKGTKPADLPVEESAKFELVVNACAAQALGLTIPLSLFARADEVIE